MKIISFIKDDQVIEKILKHPVNGKSIESAPPVELVVLIGGPVPTGQVPSIYTTRGSGAGAST